MEKRLERQGRGGGAVIQTYDVTGTVITWIEKRVMCAVRLVSLYMSIIEACAAIRTTVPASSATLCQCVPFVGLLHVKFVAGNGDAFGIGGGVMILPFLCEFTLLLQ